MKKILPLDYLNILVICIGFSIIYLVSQQVFFIYLAVALGLVAIMSRTLATYIQYAWLGLAYILSFISPTILLFLIYYLLLTPLAYLSKLFGKADPLMLATKYPSTFKKVNKSFDSKSFEKPW